jgi:hypothetical protein
MKYILLPATLIFALLGCEPKEQQMAAGNNKPPSFATAEEAANDAKSDLLTVLRTQKNINLGLDEAAVEKSQPGKALKHYQITFDELASADATIFTKAHNEIATVVPLVADNNIVTVAGVGTDAGGWRVASVVDKGISDDLNLLWRVSQDAPQGSVTIYDLPHSSVRIYAVTKAGGSTESPTVTFYTNYPGFNMQEGVDVQRLLAPLQRDAAEFQRKYGDALKNQEVVH